MSYSFTAGPATKHDIFTDVHHAVGDLSPGNADHERSDHIEAVMKALQPLVFALGLDDDRITVTVSGHSNVGHAHSDQWADEMIQLSVSVAPTRHVLSKDCPCEPIVETVPSGMGMSTPSYEGE